VDFKLEKERMRMWVKVEPWRGDRFDEVKALVGTSSVKGGGSTPRQAEEKRGRSDWYVSK
jgi:hypothetical protein